MSFLPRCFSSHHCCPQAEDAQRQLLLMEFAIFSQLRDAVLGVADLVLAVCD